MANIGVYGGAFNPPHKGHILLARQAIARLKLDKLIIIPSFISPHKSNDNLVDGQTRLKMVHLAFDSVDKAEVSDIEIKRGGVSYTVDTLMQIKKQFPSDNLYLLMGDDMFLSFDTWRSFEIIFNLATIGVLLRDKQNAQQVLDKAIEYKLKYKAVVAFIKNIVYDASSSEIRNDFDKNYTKLDIDVALFAIENSLYSNQYSKTIKKIEKYLKATVSPKRLEHIYGTRDEAVKLAKRYGADAVKAYIAGFLHDVTKELTYEEQSAILQKYSDERYDEQSYKIMHSVTGSIIAKTDFGITDKEILSAIRYHTTGRADMTLLEKIIYIADYIEPNRSYQDVDELRKIAYQDIDHACIVGLKYTIESLKEKKRAICKDTIKAYEFYTGEKI